VAEVDTGCEKLLERGLGGAGVLGLCHWSIEWFDRRPSSSALATGEPAPTRASEDLSDGVA